MDTKKLLLGTLIGGIASFLLGWLVWGILLKDYVSMPEDVRAVVEKPFEMPLMMLSNLAWGALLAYILLKWTGISTFMGGLTFGATVGFLVSLSMDLGFMSMTNIMTTTSTVADIIANTVVTGISAGLIAWYYGR